MAEKRRGQESENKVPIEHYMEEIGGLLGMELKHFDNLSQEEKIKASGVFADDLPAAADSDSDANNDADSDYTATNKVAKKVSPKVISKAKKAARTAAK